MTRPTMPTVVYRCEVCDEMVLEPQLWLHLDLGRSQRYGFHDECWTRFLGDAATAAPHLAEAQVHIYTRHTGPATCEGCARPIDDADDRVTLLSSEPARDGTVRYLTVYHPACGLRALQDLAPG